MEYEAWNEEEQPVTATVLVYPIIVIVHLDSEIILLFSSSWADHPLRKL